jgi:hypothetical protein
MHIFVYFLFSYTLISFTAKVSERETNIPCVKKKQIRATHSHKIISASYYIYFSSFHALSYDLMRRSLKNIILQKKKGGIEKTKISGKMHLNGKKNPKRA